MTSSYVEEEVIKGSSGGGGKGGLWWSATFTTQAIKRGNHPNQAKAPCSEDFFPVHQRVLTLTRQEFS